MSGGGEGRTVHGYDVVGSSGSVRGGSGGRSPGNIGDPGVRPALSRERWTEELADGHPYGEQGEAFLDDGDLFVEYATGCAAVHVPNRHALAALALYGQPFGFDFQDIVALYNAATFLESGGEPQPPLMEQLRDLASRISALLPEEK